MIMITIQNSKITFVSISNKWFQIIYVRRNRKSCVQNYKLTLIGENKRVRVVRVGGRLVRNTTNALVCNHYNGEK